MHGVDRARARATVYAPVENDDEGDEDDDDEDVGRRRRLVVSTFSKHELLAVETTVNLAGKATVGKIKGTVLAYYRSGSRAVRGERRTGRKGTT